MRTSASGWVRTIWQLANHLGLDASGLFDRAGLDATQLNNPVYRYPQDNITLLWGMLVEATGNPGLGLEFGPHVSAATFNAIGYAMQSSATLREALEQAMRYQQWLSEATRVSLCTRGEQVQLCIENEGDQVVARVQSVEATLSAIYHFSRWVSPFSAVAPSVSIAHVPTVPLDRYESCFGGRVEVNAPVTALIFPADILAKPLPGYDPVMRQHHLAFVDEHARQSLQPTSETVRTLLATLLPVGEASMEQVARRMNCSTKTLQRRLQAENATFTSISEAFSFDLACRFLRQAHLDLTDVSLRCGYADYSAFTKAFRRWAGKTPKAWRSAYLSAN
ncbi:MAG: AraC family transcriptional regulator [Hahellaceae bacterium]|nr:AraC family transcriptional regulator [Hahellaceae bacterium]MCP5169755.1 AraC family transcriptional regulator [Hahellaceae bacterium]